MLQTLHIYIERSLWIAPAGIYLPDGLFANSAPALLSVRLDGITSRHRAYHAFSKLRILDLKQPEIDLVRVLDYYPRLEQLRAYTRTLVTGRRKINPHSLRLLDLRGSREDAEQILNRLVLTRPLSVWMSNVEDDALMYILSAVPRNTIRRVQFCLEYGTLNNACVLGLSTRVTWVLMIPPSAAPGPHILPFEEVMANIVELSFHELVWPDCVPDIIPPALCLDRLEIVLDTFAATSSHVYVQQFVMGTASLFCERRPFVLRCPVLKEIYISAPAGKMSPLVVDVYDVCDFIDRDLAFGTALPCLVLRNVHLYDPGLGLGMQRLTAAVSDVSYRPAFVASIPELHRDSKKTWLYNIMG